MQNMLQNQKQALWVGSGMLALLIVSLIVAIAGSNSSYKPMAVQPDTRPASLTVVTGGTGVSSPEAAAALQLPLDNASLSAPTSAQNSLMGQTGGVSLQAGVGNPSTGVQTAPGQIVPMPADAPLAP